MKNANTKMVFDLAKLPTLNYYKTQIEGLKKMIDCLNKRTVLIKENYDDKSEYEKNEIEITLLKTDKDLARAHKDLSEKEKLFVSNSKDIAKEIDDINGKFDMQMAKALAYKGKPEIEACLKQLFADVKDIDLSQNYDAKIMLYINVKATMEESNKKKK